MMSGDGEDLGEPFYIDVQRFLANTANAEAVGVAMDLIACVWWPVKTPFVFDEETLAARLASELPAPATRHKCCDSGAKRSRPFSPFWTDDGHRAPDISV
jgi:hypothetical protein